MKRTPPWVFVAAVGVQLAALGLCLWAMERNLRVHDEENAPEPPASETPPPPQPQAETRRDALAAAPAPTLADIAFAYHPAPMAAEPEHPAEPEPARAPEWSPEPAWREEPPREPELRRELDPAPRQVIVRAVQRPPESPPAPLFGPPPERPLDPVAAPVFITEAADATTQIVVGRMNDGEIAFGFYPDGNMRFVDLDGSRYIGRAESARARMREVDGMRAFTVQIGVGADQRFQATFTGGPHDAETIGLEPLVGWSVA
jgi:hypothetical protein